MKVSKRIITFFLALAMLFSLFSFASASSASGVLVDSASVTAWNSWITSNGGSSSDYWTKINSLLARYKIGSYDTYDSLVLTVNRLDSLSSGSLMYLIEIYADVFGSSDYIVMYDNSLGVYRPYDNNTHLWLVNSAGHFPYYKETTNTEDTGSNPTLTYSWWFRSDIPTGTSYSLVPEADLRTIAKQYSGNVKQIGNYYVILDVTTTKILCSSGHPLAAIANLDQTAVNQTNNYYTQEGDQVTNEYIGGDTIINEGDTIIYEGDTITNNSTTIYEEGDTYNQQFIDIEDNSIHLADGSIYNIDNLYYDDTTSTYYVDSHDAYTYNSTTNEYTTNSFLFAVTYHINYTSITYIGQTEEYEADTYVYYYELPDGRSSADLTAEDLEQLSTVFVDVVQYARSADNVDMRVLYHFDGNTEDSSYWSYCTEFDWASGASLTYLDEGIFGGSLYLDETEHEFSITLPNTSDVFNDWTLQFRYYQSYTAAPVVDSYISVGGSTLVAFDGSGLVSASGATTFAKLSIGAWNEICLIYSDGILYRYLNGVCISSVSRSNDFSSADIVFHFGSDQQTYKKIDELRFTRAAVYTPGEDYTPTAVPFDTNLSLILPDGERPIADEVLVLTKSENNLLDEYGFSDWTVAAASSGLSTYTKPSSISTSNQPWKSSYSEKFSIVYNASYADFSFDSGVTSFSSSGTAFTASTKIGNYTYTDFRNGFMIPINGFHHSYTNSLDYSLYDNWRALFSNNTTYCFSVVLADGTYSYIVFEVVNNLASSSASCSVTQVDVYNGSYIQLSIQQMSASYTNSSYDIYQFRMNCVSAIPNSGSTADIVYMELVAGSEPQFTSSLEVAMYSSGELEDSPVLAVRTNQTITGYQIGGVRPSYPTKGLVYAMVENSRITSLQQYSGSAWVEVDGRIWTGKRWVPYSSFDVFTLQDYFDMIGSSDDDYEYIYTESGFWAWLQKAWANMLQKLDLIILALGGDPDAVPGDDSGDDSNLTFWQRVKKIFEESLAKIIESLLDLITRILDVVLGLVYDLLEFFFDLLSDIVVNGIGEFFVALTDEALLQFFHSEEPVLDENGDPVLSEDGDPVTTTVVALPAGVAGVFAFISATIMVLPDELRGVLFFGMSALLLLAVLKLIRA